MIRIYSEGERISWTAGDTFLIDVASTDEFETGSRLNFQIAQNEQSESVVNKLFDLIDGRFEILLSEEEIKALSIGNYIYKLAVVDAKGKITTRKSGELTVKWGA